jgi:peptide/nickel transport system permease protein
MIKDLLWRPPSTSRGTLRKFFARPLACFAFAYMSILLIACIFAPLIAPYNPESEDLLSVLSGPSHLHLLGTDELGRDVLSRLLFGGQVTLLNSLEAVLAFAIIGVPLGLFAGYRGGRIDRTIMSATDIVQSLPVIIVLLVVAAVFTGSLALMITLGLVSSPSIIRVVRVATLSVRSELYVRAAEVVGLKKLQILRRHILPQVVAPMAVQVSVFAAAAITIEAALGYLNLDVSPPAPSWGSMIAEAATVIFRQPFLIIPSGLIIVFTVIALGILGDAIRDIWANKDARGEIGSRREKKTSSHANVTVTQLVPDDNAIDAAPHDSLLSVRNLEVMIKSREGDLKIVDHVSFDLKAGETLGVVGESGCGKSIMALALLGLLPAGGRITNGSVEFRGQQLVGMPKKERAMLRGRHIGLVSQEPMVALDPVFTVGSQIKEVLQTLHGSNAKEARRDAIELLGRARLPDPQVTFNSYPHELSGGMAQRACIAIALAGRPDLLIADEPTTALDVTVQAEILDLLLSLNDELKMSILLVTHDWGVIADSCERTAVMYAGQLVELATVDEIFNVPLHPYTEGLLASNPYLSDRGSLPSIKGVVPSPWEWPAGCRFAPRCPYATEDCTLVPIPARSMSADRVTRCLHSERIGR